MNQNELKHHKMQTKFKDIAQYYLGTGLEIRHNDGDDLIMNATGSGSNFISIDDIEEYGKPLLRSLDSLTKPITVKGYNDGKDFVPAIEIAKLCDNGHNHTDSKVKDYKSLIVIRTDKCDDVENISIRFIGNEITSISRGGNNVTFITHRKITQLLIKLHFNIFNLEETEYIKID